MLVYVQIINIYMRKMTFKQKKLLLRKHFGIFLYCYIRFCISVTLCFKKGANLLKERTITYSGI